MKDNKEDSVINIKKLNNFNHWIHALREYFLKRGLFVENKQATRKQIYTLITKKEAIIKTCFEEGYTVEETFDFYVGVDTEE